LRIEEVVRALETEQRLSRQASDGIEMRRSGMADNWLAAARRWAVPCLVAMAAAALAPTSRAFADEGNFLKRFDARWSGGGQVVRNADTDPSPVKVNCTLDGDGGGNAVSVGGTCRAYLLFTREFGARMRYDPATGQYRGTYLGARSGPATLAGKRNGDTVNLTITWAKNVNGDRKARLSIRNDGRTLSIRMTDRAKGRDITTTDLVFAQR
jgi:hypothetical protein